MYCLHFNRLLSFDQHFTGREQPVCCSVFYHLEPEIGGMCMVVALASRTKNQMIRFNGM